MRHFWLVYLLTALGAYAADTTAGGPDTRIFEMRTYHAAPGKFEALKSRFALFTDKLMVKHGIEIIGSWIPQAPAGGHTEELIYVVAFPTMAQRDKAWKDFADDLEWLAVKTDTEQKGKLIAKVDSVFMTAKPSAAGTH